MNLACFLVSCCEGHSSHVFDHSTYDDHQGNFIVLFSGDISADLDISIQYDVVRKAIIELSLALLLCGVFKDILV